MVLALSMFSETHLEKNAYFFQVYKTPEFENYFFLNGRFFSVNEFGRQHKMISVFSGRTSKLVGDAGIRLNFLSKQA